MDFIKHILPSLIVSGFTVTGLSSHTRLSEIQLCISLLYFGFGPFIPASVQSSHSGAGFVTSWMIFLYSCVTSAHIPFICNLYVASFSSPSFIRSEVGNCKKPLGQRWVYLSNKSLMPRYVSLSQVSQS